MSRGEGGEKESTVRSIIRKERGECTVRVYIKILGEKMWFCVIRSMMNYGSSIFQ